MKNRFFPCAVVLLCLIIPVLSGASDWPVYKGNIYYTGNNDEVTVKNSNLKWLFQAGESVHNPIVSEGRVYFTDLKKNVYCLDEDTGKLVWKLDLARVSSQFSAYSRAMGTVKYPLIRGPRLFLTDNIAIYCLEKNTGSVVWARTGIRSEVELSRRERPVNNSRFKQPPAAVDSIYSNPVINDDLIYYGTRNVFIAREIANGHLKWNNDEIKSYSGFPSFYDEYIFTQSMDFSKGTFSLYCLAADTGKVKWVKTMPKPHKIFSPVVYKGRVYLANGKTLYCMDLKSGEPVWNRDFPDFITSNPGFTERAIAFTVGNRSLYMINPSDGSESARIEIGEQSSPYFVIIRDQFYVSHTFKKEVAGRELSYTSLKALRLNEKNPLWEFVPPFPGGASQPVASNGIMFVPAGNYLYAVGTDYYPRIIKGGSSTYDPYDKSGGEPSDKDRDDSGRKPAGKDGSAKDKTDGTAKKKDGEPIRMRDMKISITDKDGSPVPAEVEIRKWDKGKLVYSRKLRITKPDQTIQVPDSDDVEITADADDHVPKKEIIGRKDREKKIALDRIEKGQSIVVDNIYFEVNEAYLKKESLNILDRIIDSLKANKRIKLEVRGFTDSTGTREHNRKLSERRADAVVEYMIKHGVSPDRLDGKGFGSERPVASNATESGRKKNRRTEFMVLEK